MLSAKILVLFPVRKEGLGDIKGTRITRSQEGLVGGTLEPIIYLIVLGQEAKCAKWPCKGSQIYTCQRSLTVPTPPPLPFPLLQVSGAS